jgi:hypothetical protein
MSVLDIRYHTSVVRFKYLNKSVAIQHQALKYSAVLFVRPVFKLTIAITLKERNATSGPESSLSVCVSVHVFEEGRQPVVLLSLVIGAIATSYNDFELRLGRMGQFCNI